MIVIVYALVNGSMQLTAGELTTFILYCSSLANTSSMISSTYSKILNGVVSLEKVFDMMNYKRLIEEDVGR